MAAPDRSDLQRELTDAFDAFRATLGQMLEDEARRSVEATIARLSSQGGPFKVVDADVQIVIRRLELSAEAQGATGAPEAGVRRRHASPQRARARRARTTRGASRAGGRSGVREALLETFAETDAEMTTDDVQGALTARGVKTSTDNLYQQLRRLVQAGELVRPSRGRYRRARSAAVA